MPQCNRGQWWTGLAGAGLALLLLALITVRPALANDVALWALLKKPGHIVLLRHSNAPGATPEGYDIDLKNCAIQRNLDHEGRAQARRIGDAFRLYGIKRAHLVSSRFCRALETGKHTGLGPLRELPALNQIYALDLDRLQEATGKVRAFMKTIPANQLTVMISHVSNIQSIAGVLLSSGEMAVVHLDASGAVVVDGRIMVP